MKDLVPVNLYSLSSPLVLVFLGTPQHTVVVLLTIYTVEYQSPAYKNTNNSHMNNYCQSMDLVGGFG